MQTRFRCRNPRKTKLTMTFQALLTDLDGTLVHSQDPICEALKEAFRHVEAVAPSKQAILNMFGLPVEVMLISLSDVQENENTSSQTSSAVVDQTVVESETSEV